MNRNMIIRRLWWKELRQLVPLIGLLMLVGVLLILFSLSIKSPTSQQYFVLVVLLGMPSLFAAGAGALLVGQEKEVRSIDWLRTLPVISADLALTKLLAAMLGLFVVWLVSLGLALVARVLMSSGAGTNAMWVWPLYSLYLLLVGFATAWQLRSSLVSLLLVVPLAGLPLLLAHLHEWIIAWDPSLNRDPAAWLVAVYIALVGGCVFGWGRRAALAYMSPERSSVSASEQHAMVAPAAFDTAPRSSPAPALLWQFYAQNRGLLLGLAGVLIACSYALLKTYALLYAGSDTYGLPWAGDLFGFLTIVPIFVSISWLGLLAFQTDTLQRRSQFLADRGVSPGLTWLTRQAFPWLSLVVAASIALYVSRDFLTNASVQIQVAVIATSIAIMGASQWLGQTLRSVILCAILAPLISFLFAGYLIHAATTLLAPSWVIALTLALPLVATFGATAAWMDGRSGWRLWAWHAALLGLVVLLPSSTYVYLIATYPRMSAASREELTRLAVQPPGAMGNSNNWLSMHSGNPADVASDSQAKTDRDLAESRSRSLDTLRLKMDMDSRAVAGWDTIMKLAADAIVARLSDPSAADDERVRRYRTSLELIVEFAKRQRRSLALIGQDSADNCEMLMLEEMQAPLAEQRMGAKLHAAIVSLLADPARRNAARRTALAASWQAAQPSKLELISADRPMLGGYDMLAQELQQHVTLRELWQASRKVGLVSELLLQLLDATSDAQRESVRSKIYALLNFRESPNISSGAYLQSAAGPKLLYGELGTRSVPGRTWGGEWEHRAAALRTE